MTDLAGSLFGVEKMRLHSGSMSVVAQAALLEHGSLVSVDLRKIISPMAIETPAFEDETTTLIQAMALRTLHGLNRWMLMKWLKGFGRIRTNEETYFLLTALPHQNQRVQARGYLQ